MAGAVGAGLGQDGEAVAELGVARVAIADALDGLSRASALAWDSPAGDAFRSRVGEVVAAVRRNERAVDEASMAAARLEASW